MTMWDDTTQELHKSFDHLGNVFMRETHAKTLATLLLNWIPDPGDVKRHLWLAMWIRAWVFIAAAIGLMLFASMVPAGVAAFLTYAIIGLWFVFVYQDAMRDTRVRRAAIRAQAATARDAEIARLEQENRALDEVIRNADVF